MSVEPTEPTPPEPTPPAPRRSFLLPLVGLLIVLVLIVAGVTLLPKTSETPTPVPPSATAPGPTATELVAAPTGSAVAGLSTGTAVAGGAGTPAGLPSAEATTARGVLTGTTPAGTPGTPGTAFAAGTPGTATTAGTPGTPGTATAAGTPGTPGTETAAGTPVAAPTGISVLDSSGTAFVCGLAPGCTQAAVAGMAVTPGGEVRTGPDGQLRLQTPAGLVVLTGTTTLRVMSLDPQQAAITLNSGRVLAQAAPGRTVTLTITTTAGSVAGMGTSFGVAVLPSGGMRVAVPALGNRPVQVQGSGTAPALAVAPGQQVTVDATGTAGAAGPLDATEAAALAAMGAFSPAGTPVAAQITELPVPAVSPFPSGAVTATIVLTPPPEQTLPPVAGGTGTPVAGGVVTATVTLGPTPPGPAGLMVGAARAMSGVPSYTFGATLGANPATAEFSAGTLAGDTACWITTVNAARTDYQVRGGLVFQRVGTGGWQQQPNQQGIPAWMTYWKLLEYIDPGTVSDLGTTQMDAVTVRHLRAQLQPASGLTGLNWIDAFISDQDQLVRGLVLYKGDPAANDTFFKIGYSSLGAPLSCPPLSAP
jgi:FecR protein